MNSKITNKLNQYFIERLGFFDYRNGWLKGDCPYCGREKKFGIHLGLNKSNCFICGKKTRPLFILTHTENLENYNEVIKFLNAFEGYEYFYELVDIIVPGGGAQLPEGFRSLDKGTGQIARSARDMVERRGFDLEILTKKGFGYCVSGKYNGYLIMPFYHNGKLVYFHARRILAHGPKFNNPEKEEVGIGKSMALYNLDHLYIFDTVYLVESVLNAETLGDQGIAAGGKSWSDYQLSLVMNSPVKNVVLILDPDAISESIKYCFYFFGHKNVKNIILPTGKDVNDMGEEYVMDRINNSAYLNYTDLIKMKNHYARSEYSHY